MKPLFIAPFLKPEEIKTTILSFIEKLSITRGTMINASLQQVADNTISVAMSEVADSTNVLLKASPPPASALTIDPTFKSSISINSITMQDINSTNPLMSFESMLSKIPQTTQDIDIIIMAHGTIMANEHFIAFPKQEGHINIFSFVKTRDLFSKITTALPNTKVSILFDSCFGGMAQAYKDTLTIGSSLYSLSSDETTLASIPITKTLENYPAGLDYSPRNFITRLLSQRSINFACTEKESIEHSVDIVPERIIYGTSGNDNIKMYICDTRNIDNDLFKKVMPELRAAINNDNSMIHFLEALNVERLSRIASRDYDITKNIHMAPYDHLLSLLSFITDTGVAFRPNAQFANSLLESNVRLNITFDQYSMLFYRDPKKDFSNSSIIDLLMMRYKDHTMTSLYSEQTHKDVSIDALIQNITGNNADIPNPYAALDILCDITKDHIGKHFLRIGLAVHECNIVSLIVIPISESDISDLLSGGITSTYDYFIIKLHSINLTKIFSDMVMPNLAQDIGDKVREIAPKFEEIWDMIVTKLNKNTDKFGANFCKQLDKAVAKMVKFHELAVFNSTSDLDLVTHCVDYMKSTHDTFPDIIELAGNPSIKYDMNLGEFME